MDLKLALMCGIDIPIPECQLIVHQPTIKEIAFIGEKCFFSGIQCLCINKFMLQQDENVLSSITNFQIFMTIMSQKESLEKRTDVQQVCALLFPQYKILFTPRALVFNGEAQNILIDESNFETFQKVLSMICCINNSNSINNSNFNPASKKAKEIAEKLMKGRKKIAEQNNEQDISLFSQYLSSLTIGISSMSLFDLMNLTIYQFYDLIERYSLYTSWDIDIRSRLAGAQMDSKPDNWMKNIH